MMNGRIGRGSFGDQVLVLDVLVEDGFSQEESLGLLVMSLELLHSVCLQKPVTFKSKLNRSFTPVDNVMMNGRGDGVHVYVHGDDLRNVKVNILFGESVQKFT